MSNNVFPNVVIGDKFKSILTTKLDVNNYMTVDRSLVENAGMKKTINTYTPNGSVETLAQGVGNSGTIDCSYIGHDYEVEVKQGKSVYYDEQAMKDPNVVDVLVRGQAEAMVNAWTADAIAQMGRTTQTVECDFTTTSAGYFFGKVADAAALLGENAENFSLLISPNNVAYVRKQLGEDLKYVEGFVRTGYIGSVCGFPVVMTKACPDSCALLVNKEAVTLFLKKDTEVEQERDADTRTNRLFIRKVGVAAMTDATKAVVLGKAQSTSCAITTYTKNAKTIAGTCGTDCWLVVVTDGDGISYNVTPVSGSWTVSAEANLTAGDKINAVAYSATASKKAASEVTVAS